MGLVGKKTYYDSDGVRIDVNWDDENSPLLSSEDVRKAMNPKRGMVRRILSDGTEVLEEGEFKTIG